MSIKLRLIVSYIAMLVIPVLLFGIAVAVIALALIIEMRGLDRFLNEDLKGHDKHAARMLNQDAFAELRAVTKYAPQQLENTAWLQEIDGKLMNEQRGFIVRRNGRIVYTSPLFGPEINAALPEASVEDTKDCGDCWRAGYQLELGERHINYSRFDEQLPGGEMISVFMLEDYGRMQALLHRYLPWLAVALLLALVATNGLLTYWVSRSIVKPLRVLKNAVEHIKDGNLDFPLIPEAKNEFGALSRAFEEMRQKLKESISLQLQYEENRKELVSNISHDLKTPITSIKGYVEGIRDGVANTPEKLDKYVQTIYRKAVEMDELIDELFLYSKLDLNRVPFHMERLNLIRYMEDIVEDSEYELEQRGIRIALSRSGQTKELHVRADREKLNRVIRNIIGNSVKFMDKPDGRIDIELREDKTSVQVRIADNGPGLAPEEAVLIFDRFYRSDKSRGSGQGGSGLGLAIAKQIIEGHDGWVWAEGKPGEGLTVCFTLGKYTESKQVDA